MALESKKLTRPLFLVRDEYGKEHWYVDDPLNPANRRTEVNIGEFLADLVGSGSILCPVRVNIEAALMYRGEEFTPTSFGKVKSQNGLPMGVFDLEGSRVEIADEFTDDPVYVRRGLVYGKDDNLEGERTYTIFGECSDGEEAHNLVVLYRQR